MVFTKNWRSKQEFILSITHFSIIKMWEYTYGDSFYKIPVRLNEIIGKKILGKV